MKNEIYIILIILSLAVTAIFVPLSLLYFLAVLGLLALYMLYKQEVDTYKGQMWPLVPFALAGLLSFMTDGKMQIMLLFVSTAFLIRLVVFNYNRITASLFGLNANDKEKVNQESKIESLTIQVQQMAAWLAEQRNLQYNEMKTYIDKKVIALSDQEFFTDKDREQIVLNISKQLQNSVKQKMNTMDANIQEIYSAIDNIKYHKSGTDDIGKLQKSIEQKFQTLEQDIKAVSHNHKYAIDGLEQQIDNKMDTIFKLVEQISEFDQATKNLIIKEFIVQCKEEGTDFSNLTSLENEQIREKFIETFMFAKKEINIQCPWMNNGVINNNFMELMKKALDNGVTIKILYGISDNIRSNSQKRVNVSDEIADNLRKKFSKYTNFKIKKDNTHAKMLICDDSYYLVGSYNFLSFDGNYHKYDNVRREVAIYSESKKQILENRTRYFCF